MAAANTLRHFLFLYCFLISTLMTKQEFFVCFQTLLHPGFVRRSLECALTSVEFHHVVCRNSECVWLSHTQTDIDDGRMFLVLAGLSSPFCI